MMAHNSMPPRQPKIYHIVHQDRLPAIIEDGYLWSDAEMVLRGGGAGTAIGMGSIKQRRRNLPLNSHPDLHVGACVPFYFCPRSIMLYAIYRANHSELRYRGGQAPIVHLEADLHQTVEWAEQFEQRWVFTDSNAGSSYFNDWSDLAHLGEVNWVAVQAWYWQEHKHGKQAEFLVERQFPWHLTQRIGVLSGQVHTTVSGYLHASEHQPRVEVRREWYY
ncbi:MAG: DUF4433 domain-containing protein [Caldilineaceae bacterium]|nr:DUF4433 domain-containing protein [Caldilineaceae bacterium]